MQAKVSIIWFRRDLRLTDNAALYHALQSGNPVVPVFVFDTHILNDLSNRADRRVAFIHDAITAMQQELVQVGSTMEVHYGTPEAVFKQLFKTYSIAAVYTNHDYEQYAIDRDRTIAQMAATHGATFNSYKDQVIFEKDEVVKDDGKPYTVFTPYSRKWKAKLTDAHLEAFNTKLYFANFLKQAAKPIPTLESMEFIADVNRDFPAATLTEAIIKKYKEQRDFPAINGTSKLGVHLRFGTVSIRELAKRSMPLSEGFLNELIWRDFYHMILWHFPHINQGKAFRAAYDLIEWRNDDAAFEAWCAGKTGYPIVDAGMRELNATGYMHNRVRMVVASFLTKHLLIDWRKGEAYFAQHLLDYDFAANNGGWQWASGSGCDAAPYFRVFNPTLQTEKFDKDLRYIRKWVPEFESFNYVKPIVVHEIARKRAIETYSKVLKKTL
jgi:deoxyribodipyrimidine photo-lyase